MMKKLIPTVLLLSTIFAIPLPALAAKDAELAGNITSLESYSMVQGGEGAIILDVRTPEEYQLIGHAPMAHNIPYKFLSDEFVENGQKFRGEEVKKTRYQFYLNPDFVKEVEKKFGKDDVLLVTCRSGKRSSNAADALVKAGFNNVYNIRDGFEGNTFSGASDKDKETLKKSSAFFGHRNHVEGWKYYGLPYTYQMNPELVYQPHRQ